MLPKPRVLLFPATVTVAKSAKRVVTRPVAAYPPSSSKSERTVYKSSAESISSFISCIKENQLVFLILEHVL